MGSTPREYPTQVRLAAARSLLAGTDRRIATVSRDCGFADPAYFTRSFRADIGQSLREYRTNQTKGLTS